MFGDLVEKEDEVEVTTIMAIDFTDFTFIGVGNMG